MNDYKKYLLRSMGLKESQFIPSSLLEKDEFPGIDPDELEKGTEDEKDEHGMPIKKAELTAKQHLDAPNQGHYYSGMEKAKKAGMLKDQAMLSPMLSPTAIQTPVIGLAIRGSSTGGLPSGADQTMGHDISPSKVGGYDRVTPQNLNSTLVDKTPTNPEIRQGSIPINPAPTTGDGVTHPHQIQVTAHEEPQAVTGASTDSDPTLTLKSATPKGIDIDITETSPEEEKNENNNTAMIPCTSLSETFQRHIRLMRERIGLTEGKCPCGCEGTCQCSPNCKCKKNRNGVCECSTCGCGNPSDTHGKNSITEDDDNEGDDEPGICATCSGSGEGRADGTVCQTCKGSGTTRPRGARSEPDPDYEYEKWRDKQMGLQEGKHKSGCQCGFCKNKGSFGKKKEVKEDGGGDDPDFKEKDEKQFRKDRSASKDGDEVRKHLDKDKKKKVSGVNPADDNMPSEAEPFEESKKKQQRIDESYSAPFQRMRGLAGVGGTFLGSNGLWENKHEPGASKPFNTNWKMDKEKAGFVKVDEDKLKKVRATLNRKSKRGTLSDKELVLAKRLDEVLKKRQSGMDKQSQAVDKNIGKMEKDPTYRPSPFDKDHTQPLRKGNDKGQLPSR